MKKTLVSINKSDTYDGDVYKLSTEERVDVTIIAFFNNTFLKMLNPNLIMKSIIPCNCSGENKNDNYFYRSLSMQIKNNDKRIVFIDEFKNKQIKSEVGIYIANTSTSKKWQFFRKIINTKNLTLKKRFFDFFYKEINIIRENKSFNFTFNNDFNGCLKQKNENYTGKLNDKIDDDFYILYSESFTDFKYKSIGELTTALTLQYSLFKIGIDYSLDQSFNLSTLFLKITKKTYLYDHEINEYADFISKHHKDNGFFDLLELNYSY